MITLYLGIPAVSGIDWDRVRWSAIQDNLKQWLNSCGASDLVRVVITDKRHTMGAQDGLVYLVGDLTDSIIARVGAVGSGEFHIGSTSSLRGEMISEVYLNFMSSYGIAATIYHELLHNKFRLSRDIHVEPDGNFMSASAPYSTGGPSAGDQKVMRDALAEHATQYQGALN